MDKEFRLQNYMYMYMYMHMCPCNGQWAEARGRVHICIIKRQTANLELS